MAAFLDEILLHIFEYFDAQTLTKISLVCKQWWNISRTPHLWRRLVLRRWPSQRFLFKKVSASCANWLKVYQELFQRGSFSPDDMKYFISCRVGEDELVVSELREAMFLHMTEVVLKWTIADPFEAEDNANFPQFNRNFDFYYDTHDLKWTFIDKRREYIEDLLGFKPICAKLSRKSRYIRPYQVMPSCAMLYRWLTLFRSASTDVQGLTFYRIWRHHLKHRETGLVFELCDWKAAMSCSFLNGRPPTGSYTDDCLELMNLLSHPNFIMHPSGLLAGAFRDIGPYLCSSNAGISRQTSVSSTFSNTPKSSMEIGPENKVGWLWVTSGTESDDESEWVYDSGYFTNCEYFISISHWNVEEQHTLQSSVAESWSIVNATLINEPHLYLSFDANEESWYFYPFDPSINDLWLPSQWDDHNKKTLYKELLPLEGFVPCRHVDSAILHGAKIEPIPSCLALYRLICLFDMNVRNYVSLGEAELWSVPLIHNHTRACLHLKDSNGWFEVLVTLTEELMTELKTSKAQPSNEKPDLTAITSNPQNATQITDMYEMPASLFNDDCHYDGDDDDDDNDADNDSIISGHEPCESLFHIEELDSPDTTDAASNIYGNDGFNQGEAAQLPEHPSGDDLVPIEQSGLELFKSDVVTLLNVLMNEKFGHPYGTIAGAVA